MIRVLELFGGYGSQALALENLGIEFKSDLCDIDKYAEKAYNQLHGETFNYGDICSIDETKLPHYDLITYSSPCQDFSVAGKQAGGEKGSGTRSSLLWECERIIRAVKPKYLLMENVKALTSKKFMPLFAQWLRTLESIGYQNYWKVLNAKDYGVPQNRERVFVVSIFGGGKYYFPKPIPLTKRLKDVLETNVDEKYYISKDFESYINKKQEKDYNFRVETTDPNDIRQTPIRAQGDRPCIKEPMALDEQNEYIRQDGCVGTLTTDGSSPKKNNRVIEPKIIQEDINLYPNSGNPQAGRVYNANGISPAMDTCSGGNRMPKITEYRFFEQAIQTAEENGVKDGDTVDAFNKRVNDSGVSPTLTTRPEGFKTAILYVESENKKPEITEIIGNIYKSKGQNGNVYSCSGISPTILSGETQTKGNGGVGSNNAPKIYNNYRIRKLTPRECWRLMGVKDEQFDKLHDISNTQLYKMAGNSIVVDVLMGIFKNMFMPEEQEQKGQLILL